MPLASRYLLTAALALVAVCAGPAASASADRAFSTRYQTHTRGSLATAANTLLTCPAAVATCDPARSGTGGSRQNNAFTMEYVDVDGDATTFNSSTAQLDIPAGATVTFAGLYWGADTSAGIAGTAAPAAAFAGSALLDTPAGAGYQQVTGTQFDEASSDWPGRYQEFADVTSEVVAAGAGDYTLANVQAGTGQDRYGGWTLVVAYQLASDPIRNLSVFDGMATVLNTAGSYDLTLDGFEIPAGGVASANLGLVTYEGDYGISGDGLSLNGTTLSDPINGATNFFNSSISRGGAHVTTKSPNYVDQLGYDSDRVSVVDGLIPAGATSAALHMSTNGDTYFLGVVTLSTDQIPEPPVSGAPPVISGTAEDGQTVTAAPGQWSGTDPIVYDYQWQRCDAAGANCVAIAGATDPTYDLVDEDAGSTVRVVVTATNDEGTDSATSDPSGVVAAVAPTNSDPPSTSGTAEDDEVLTADTGSWTGTGPYDFDYQWQRCDATGANCVDITGADDPTYELVDEDAGSTIRVVVTATNDEGTESATSDASPVVAAVAPSGGTPSPSGPDRTGDTLTADDGTWTGTGPYDFDYQWQRCDADGDHCMDIPGATDNTYELTPEDVGNTIVVIVTATNPQGSDSVTSAPTAPIAAIAQVPPPANDGDGGVAALALRSDSSIALNSCQQLTGSQVLAFKIPGGVRFRIRVAPSGRITAARPLRASSPVSALNAWKLNSTVRRVVYKLGSRRLATRRRAPYAVRIGPSKLRRAARQTLTVRVVPKRGKPRVARVQLNSKPCSELFSVVHRPSPSRSLLGLRVDSVNAVHGVVFRVPARLLAKPGTRGVAGKLRVRVAGRKAMNFRLSFPRKKTRTAILLKGAGRPQVKVSGGRITVSGLPAGTGGIRLRLRARGMLITPRAKLRALVQTDGSGRRLTQRLGIKRR